MSKSTSESHRKLQYYKIREAVSTFVYGKFCLYKSELLLRVEHLSNFRKSIFLFGTEMRKDDNICSTLLRLINGANQK